MEYTEKKWDMKILSKWKKSLTKDYILYDSIYMVFLEMTVIEMSNRWLPGVNERVGVGDEWGWLWKGNMIVISSWQCEY